MPQVVAVLDEGGHLLAFARMDGSPLPSVQASQDKAYSALIGVPTDQFSSAVAADPRLHEALAGIERVTLIGGGAPLLADGRLVGAVGVGGGTPEQDVECARAGCAVLGDAGA